MVCSWVQSAVHASTISSVEDLILLKQELLSKAKRSKGDSQLAQAAWETGEKIDEMIMRQFKEENSRIDHRDAKSLSIDF